MKKRKVTIANATKGNLQINRSYNPVFSVDAVSVGKPIAICGNPFLDPAENEANAQLLSASRAMYEALKVIPPSRFKLLIMICNQLDKLQGYKDKEVQRDLKKMARLSEKALAKAEGRE